MTRQNFSNLNGKAGDPSGKAGDPSELAAPDDPATEEPGGAQAAEEPQPKTYTTEEVDNIVKGRLARERQKMEDEIRRQIDDDAEAKKTEAQRLESMTELEKAKYRAQQLEKEKAELEGRFNLYEQMAVARKDLAEAGITLGDDLLGMFVSSSADDTGKAIAQIKELWPKAVNAAVQEALRRNPPAASNDGGGKSFGASFAEQYSKSMNGGK